MSPVSKIYRGEVTHERLEPESHAFTYPMTFFALELSELNTLSRTTSLFGYNESRPLKICDEDYLRGHKIPIASQLEGFLPKEVPGQHTLLISSPRYFGYAFNPVNFYLRMEGSDLVAAVAEVNNTFGDRHTYPLLHLTPVGRKQWAGRCPKDFHVSPFNDRTGEYRFTFRVEPDELFLGVDLWKENRCVMKTWIQGKGQQLTNRAIAKYALLHPFDTALNSMPRILWQAAKLHYKKKLKIYQRPAPASENTIIDRDQPEKLRDVV